MPAAQLLTAAIEAATNRLLALDPDSQRGLVRLSGKQLQVQMRELPFPLTFAFSDRVDVMSQAVTDADCSISLGLDTLPLLQDTSQLSQLIKEDKLGLEGDLQVAQDFSQLLKQLNIDWEEQLSRYTGDVFAHSFFRTARQIRGQFGSFVSQLGSTLSEGLIEEKQVAAHPLAVEHFCQQVHDVRSATERLEARLARLEQQ